MILLCFPIPTPTSSGLIKHQSNENWQHHWKFNHSRKQSLRYFAYFGSVIAINGRTEEVAMLSFGKNSFLPAMTWGSKKIFLRNKLGIFDQREDRLGEWSWAKIKRITVKTYATLLGSNSRMSSETRICGYESANRGWLIKSKRRISKCTLIGYVLRKSLEKVYSKLSSETSKGRGKEEDPKTLVEDQPNKN